MVEFTLVMDEFVYRGILYELYGGILNDKQKKVYMLHNNYDLSFSEIGAEMKVTRQAAQTLFKAADLKLKKIDEELKLSQKFFEINKYANDILTKSRDKKIASLARKIINLT